jgi:aspartyl-tRNA(Asn)/glutamyl-tRNA(Gln) amidotransferase subunit B
VSASPLEDFELVVGMEVHAQLNTNTKLFCACPLEFGAAPNTRTCPVCLGHPGVLPVLNREAFAKGLRVAVAFGADVQATTWFDRKNYYYPDLPKNYQISQMHHNLGQGGELVLLRSGKVVRMDNVHLEEDAGKLSHAGQGTSAVDLNRTGTPLAEIVTQPDFRTIEEVDDYMDTLTELLRALDVCGCQMQEGNLRFEASVSVRPHGSDALGQRTEIKNLNSYTAVRRSVAYERARQIALLVAGKTPRQETRLWDEAGASPYEHGVPEELTVPQAQVLALLPKDWSGRTQFMRSKEDAHDYRYFPEPDLPALAVSPAQVAEVRAALPELPGPRRARYSGLGLALADACDLARDRARAAYFERLVELGVGASDAAKYVLNQVSALLNARGVTADACPVPPEHVAELHAVIASGELPKSQAFGQVWPRVTDEGLSPRQAIERYGIQAAGEDAVRTATDEAWANNPKAVADLLGGNNKARGAIVGAVMKATKGQASPKVVNARIGELLERARAEQAGGEA